MRARDNPFATERVLRLRYQFRESPAGGWQQLLCRLQALNYHAAVVGPHGSGKTTLLENLGSRLRSEGFRIHSVFLNRQEREFPAEFLRRVGRSLTSRDIVLLDGCEQLGLINWRRFRWQTRRAGGLIITMHRPGRLPLLRFCHTDPDLLCDLIRQLTGPAGIDASAARRLYEAHRGNVREALRDLYDLAARV